jgi:uncharacterized membrane protein YuzA (DUF378 family)
MKTRSSFGAHILVGSCLVLAGGALVLENLGVINIGSVWRFWPIVLIGLGIVRIREATSRREQGAGVFFLLLGLWFMASIMHICGATFADTWPVLFIVVGVSMIWKSLPGISAINQERENPHGA